MDGAGDDPAAADASAPVALAVDPRAAALQLLDEREEKALRFFEAAHQAPIASSTADRMFTLFLRGLSTEDIRKIGWGFGLGQIVDARVRYEWDRRMAEHDQALVLDGAAAIRRSQMEAALLAADMISASSVMNRERIHRFLLTRDEKDLGDLAIGNLKHLRECLDILMKATGQDQPRKGPAPEESVAPPSTVSISVGAPAGDIMTLAARQREARLLEQASARSRRRR